MKRKAAAQNLYQEAAKSQMILDNLPKVIHEITKPMMSCKNVTLVSSNGSDIGAHKLTGEVMNILNMLPETVHNLTGVDIAINENSKLLSA